MHSHPLNTRVTVVLAQTMPKNGTPAAQQTAKSQNIKSANQTKAAASMVQLKPTPTKVAPIKTVTAKTVPTKVVPKKVIPKAVPVKTPPVKTVPVKAPAKKIPEKTVPRKIEPPKLTQPKTIEKKPVSEQKKQPEIASKLVEQNKLLNAVPILAQQNIAQPEQVRSAGQQNNEQICIEVPYHQAREFYQQEALRKELSKHWKPPYGMPDTCTCEVTTYVSKNGVVTDCVITESSGILMYDVSARAAILAMDLPRWTWGDSFTTNFKP